MTPSTSRPWNCRRCGAAGVLRIDGSGNVTAFRPYDGDELRQVLRIAASTINLYVRAVEGDKAAQALVPHGRWPGGDFNASSSAAGRRALDIIRDTLGEESTS